MLRSEPKYLDGKHLRKINQSLLDIESGKIDRLMIWAPPRHCKSELVSHYYPAWYLGHNPENQIIATSYNDELASDFGRKVRNTVGDDDFKRLFKNVELSQDSKAKDRWHTNESGVYVSAGIGGSITGRGGHRILIDDPIKNSDEAESRTFRDRVWNWYLSTIYSRQMPQSAIIVMLTRWHDDDLAGRLLKEQKHGGDKWTVLEFPAINDKGEALWPEYWPLKKLLRIKANLKSQFYWDALYQQKPVKREGSIFKLGWFPRYKKIPERSFFDQVIQSWDTAFKDKEQNDPSACSTFGVKNRIKYLLEVLKVRAELPQLLTLSKTQAMKWQANRIVIEDKASGQDLAPMLKRETKIPVTLYRSSADKVARAHMATGSCASGEVLLPDDAIMPAWFPDFIDELTGFPKVEHDDQVDSFSQGINYLEDPMGKPSITFLGPDAPDEVEEEKEETPESTKKEKTKKGRPQKVKPEKISKEPAKDESLPKKPVQTDDGDSLITFF